MIYKNAKQLCVALSLIGLSFNLFATVVAICPAIKTVRYDCCKFAKSSSSVWLDRDSQSALCEKKENDCTLATRTYEDPGSEFGTDKTKWVTLSQVWGKNGCNLEHSNSNPTKVSQK